MVMITRDSRFDPTELTKRTDISWSSYGEVSSDPSHYDETLAQPALSAINDGQDMLCRQRTRKIAQPRHVATVRPRDSRSTLMGGWFTRSLLTLNVGIQVKEPAEAESCDRSTDFRDAA